MSLTIFYFVVIVKVASKNLTLLYSFAVLPPPTKLELTLAGKAKEKQWTSPGTYILNDSLVNGYPHWLKTDGNRAIWFNKVTSSWLVGSKSNLGTKRGGISGPDGKDSYPNEIKQGWRYSDNGFKDSGPNDVIFGTFFKPSSLQNQFYLSPFTKQHSTF